MAKLDLIKDPRSYEVLATLIANYLAYDKKPTKERIDDALNAALNKAIENGLFKDAGDELRDMLSDSLRNLQEPQIQKTIETNTIFDLDFVKATETVKNVPSIFDVNFVKKEERQ